MKVAKKKKVPFKGKIKTIKKVKKKKSYNF